METVDAVERLAQELAKETGLKEYESGYFFFARLGDNFRDYPFNWEPFRDFAGPLKRGSESIPIVVLSRNSAPEKPQSRKVALPQPHYEIEISPKCAIIDIADTWLQLLSDDNAILLEGGGQRYSWFFESLQISPEHLSAKAQSFVKFGSDSSFSVGSDKQQSPPKVVVASGKAVKGSRKGSKAAAEPQAPAREMERPQKFAGYRHHGMQIDVVETHVGWLMPIEALVVPAFGRFFDELLKDINEKTQRQLSQFAGKLDRSSFTFETPALYPLGAQTRSVLPYAPNEQGYLIFAQARDVNGLAKPEYVKAITDAVLEMARGDGIRSLAMPLIGSGYAGLNEIEALHAILDQLLGEKKYPGIETVTILTINPDVRSSAENRFAGLSHNRSQRIFGDGVKGDDQLGIEDEVTALTDTILLRDVEPPLAVGVMGGWGSGKSFIMHLMQKRIRDVRTSVIEKGWKEDGREGSISEFVGHIYVIRFNAWTYAKSNLWASLMQTIFFELNRQLSMEEVLAANFDSYTSDKEYANLYEDNYELKLEYFDKLTPEQRERNVLWRTLRGRKKKLNDDLKRDEQEIVRLKGQRGDVAAKAKAAEEPEQEKRVQEQHAVVQAIMSTAADAAGKFINTEYQKQIKNQESLTQLDVDEFFRSLGSIKITAGRVWDAAQKGGWYAFGLVMFSLLSFAITSLLTQYFNLIQQAIGYFISFITVAAPIVRIVREWSDRVSQTVQVYEEKYSSNLQALREETARQNQVQYEKDAQEILEDKTIPFDNKIEGLLRLENNLYAYDKAIALLEARAEETRNEIGPTARYMNLAEFVQARLEVGLYEKQLGLMHQIKADIDELTHGLAIQEWDDDDIKREKRQMFPRGNPRVIIFIDDLDRCPPPRMVEVLEAIQLLVNTELFIVVLGLDTRYVTLALEKEYKEILRHEGDPSGLDYIEKIIQIPYGVRPIEHAGLEKFLKSQMELEAAQPPAAPPPDKPAEATQPADDGVGQKPAETPPITPKPDEDHKDNPTEEQKKPKTLTPQTVKFQQEDLDDMLACYDLVRLTPRSIKRIVNVMKLVKIFWIRTRGFDRQRAAKRTVVGLLALSAAYPEMMREVFVDLDVAFRDPRKASQRKVINILTAFKLKGIMQNTLSWQVGRFKADVKALGQKQYCQVTLAELDQPTFNLIRSFSFVGDPSYWSDENLVTAAKTSGSVNPARQTASMEE